MTGSVVPWGDPRTPAGSVVPGGDPRTPAGSVVPGDAGTCARLSLNQATTRHLSVEQAVRLCAEAGVRGIGLWREQVTETGADRAARLVREAGMTVTSLCRGGFLTAASGAGRAAAVAENRRAIEQAAQLGAGVLALVCGGIPAGSRDLQGTREMVADGIAELAGQAAEYGIGLAIEPLHPMFCADRSVIATAAQALDIAERFGPHVGLMLDAYHVWWDPDIEASIARAGPRILGYQLSDWVLPLPADVLLGRGHIGDGCIDFRRLERAVRAAGYDGWTEVEIFNEAVWAAPAEQTLRTIVERYRQHVTEP
jgi:sugar phosphate isomerase/epimerase